MNGSAVIFFCDSMIENIRQAQSVAFDGTFWIVPSLFYQLFTIFIINGRHFSPAIFFLMTGKSQSLYQACFLKISELIPEFSPNFAISDFETASRSAFRNVWATAHISGCFFFFILQMQFFDTLRTMASETCSKIISSFINGQKH